MSAPEVRYSEKKFLEKIQIHLGLASGVHDPLLGDFLLHLFFTVQREQYLLDTLHEVPVLLKSDSVASSVAARQIFDQLPIFAAYGLKVWVVHDLEIQFLGHNIVLHEF